jgi:hypothetical protein
MKVRGQSVGCSLRAHPNGEQGDAESSHVGQQVRRIRHDRQTTSEEAPNHLGEHEHQRENAGKLQLPLGALGTVGQWDSVRFVDESCIVGLASFQAQHLSVAAGT